MCHGDNSSSHNARAPNETSSQRSQCWNSLVKGASSLVASALNADVVPRCNWSRVFDNIGTLGPVLSDQYLVGTEHCFASRNGGKLSRSEVEKSVFDAGIILR